MNCWTSIELLRRSLLFGLVAAGPVLASPSAHAPYLDLAPCSADELGRELIAQVEIEWAAAELEGDRSPSEAQPGLRVVECDLAGGTLRLELDAGGNAENVERRLELGDVPPPVRPRTAAVALVEWAQALRTPSVSTTSQVPPTAEPVRAEQARRTPVPSPGEEPTSSVSSEVERGAALHVGGGLELLGQDSHPLVASRATLEFPLGDRFRLALGGGAATTEQPASLGSTRFVHVYGEVSGGYTLLPGGTLSAWGVLGAGDAIALVSSRMHVDEATRHALLVTAVARLTLRLPLDRRWSVGAAADLGGLLVGADYRAGGEPFVSLRGLVAGGYLTVGAALTR